MNCVRCGASVDSGMKFCPKCGNIIQQHLPMDSYNENQSRYGQPESQQNYYGQPGPQQNYYGQPESQQNYYGQPESTAGMTPLKLAQTRYPMKWYKFLMVGLVLNVFRLFESSIELFFGTHFGENADLVYELFPSMKLLDTFLGIICIVEAVLAIVTCISLYSFKRRGPILLYIYYGIDIVATILYLVIATSILKPMIESVNVFNEEFIVDLIASICIFIANIIYFQKRKELFVN